MIHNAQGFNDGHRQSGDGGNDERDPVRHPTQDRGATQIIDRHRTMLRSHQVDKRPIELHAVINESPALALATCWRADRNQRQSSSSNCVISGDQVLPQQVLVNRR